VTRAASKPIGLLGEFPDHWTFEKKQWSEAAEHGLRDTFYGHGARISSGVCSGAMELFLVNGASWLVTERMGNTLFVWCYQGKGLTAIMRVLVDLAKNNGHSQVSFFTRHRAALRAVRRFKPYALLTPVQGETQYVIQAH
jgi:hypothetical protein